LDPRIEQERAPDSVLRVLVMNTKGGCGKTTVATNLATYCAGEGYGTALFDYDSQASATRWLKNRATARPHIHGVNAFEPPKPGVTRAWQMRVPEDTRYSIIDTPAGHYGANLDDRVAACDVVLIPVLPSAIDIQSTADFIRDLLLVGKARARNKKLAIIANRTRIRTRAVENLERFLTTLDIPVIARLRDTQNYVRAAEAGLGVNELAGKEAVQDVDHWGGVLDWLEHQQVQGVARPDRYAASLPIPVCR
jgi:chromosome partitioning protein